MRVDFTFEKQPSEVAPITLDLEDYLPVDDTISGTPTILITNAAGTDATDTIKDSVAVDGYNLTIVVKAGSDGDVYNVKASIVTVGGYTLEADGELRIKERTAFN